MNFKKSANDYNLGHDEQNMENGQNCNHTEDQDRNQNGEEQAANDKLATEETDQNIDNDLEKETENEAKKVTEEETTPKTEGDLLQQMEKQLQAKCQEAEELQTRYLRLQADFDNFRRRTRQEKDEIFKFALENLMTELLPVLDNYERALNARADNVQDVMAGVEMIHKQLVGILEKEGLEKIAALEQPFDPNKHDAVMQEENDQYPDNTVIQELQTGYIYNQKVIRPSMVKVSKQ